VLDRYRPLLSDALRATIAAARAATPPAPEAQPLLDELYAQIEYHFGWRDADLRLAAHGMGKLLRPTLLLLACQLAARDAWQTADSALPTRGGKSTAGVIGPWRPSASGRRSDSPSDVVPSEEAVQRAVPAAVAVELIHNFSLVHDDIEDGDAERHHRPTLWSLWGVPQAINTGDGIFAMGRMELLRLAERGVAPGLVVELAAALDRTCLALCEGQFLDMRFEGRHEISVALYLEMIARKTAALMACSCWMGARLGAPDDPALAARLEAFGRAIGIAFQLRDDLLGIWEAQALGKTAAGDLRRKKMTLPVIAALECGADADRAALLAIYAEPGAASEAQIAEMLAILERGGARERARAALGEQCAAARAALAAATATARTAATGEAPAAQDAAEALATLLEFVAADAI
jgi:geranylgeranyl diphosphate synthase type I